MSEILNGMDFSGITSQVGQYTNSVLINVARGIEKNTPQNPHKPPNTKIAVKIENASRFIALENRIGVNTLPSKI